MESSWIFALINTNIFANLSQYDTNTAISAFYTSPNLVVIAQSPQNAEFWAEFALWNIAAASLGIHLHLFFCNGPGNCLTKRRLADIISMHITKQKGDLRFYAERRNWNQKENSYRVRPAVFRAGI